jgi:hypothetical protein
MNNIIFFIIIIILILIIFTLTEHFFYYKNYYLTNIQFNNKLKNVYIKDFTENFNELINNDLIDFRSNNISITPFDDKYICVIRFSNFFISLDTNFIQRQKQIKKIININKIYLLDKNFNLLEKKILLDNANNNFNCEDIRLYTDNINKKIYFSANSYDIINNNFNVIIGTLDNNLRVDNTIIPKKNFNIIKNKGEDVPSYVTIITDNIKNYILGDFLKKISINYHLWEKNWVIFNYKNSTYIIYKWYPLHICKIIDNNLELEEIKEMPHIFAFCRGSTNGYEYDGLIWFIIHKVTTYKKYVHMLVVFDLNMNLKGYIEDFTFEDSYVEFCLGLVIEKERIIITYSAYDNKCKIAIYDKNYMIDLLLKKKLIID